MPSSWSSKRERQYEHIKDSEKARGRSTKRAKQIAAATVNKQRSEAGETVGKKQSKSRDQQRHTRRRSRAKPISRASSGKRTRRSSKRSPRRKASRR